MHSSQHTQRTDGGVSKNSVIGVLLDLNQGTLSFSVNGKSQGPVAFTGLKGVFYPAFSLNHNVQITVHSGLSMPMLDSESSEEG